MTSNTIKLDADKQSFIIKFGYDPELVTSVKGIQGRAFVSNKAGEKYWTAPFSIQTFQQVLDFADEHGFYVDDDVHKRIKTITKTAKELLDTSRSESSDFEIKGLNKELYPFQKAGVAYACKAKRLFIADMPGLGKTAQALATVHHESAYPALFVVPASLKLNWADEVDMWLPDKTKQILSGGKPQKINADIVVMNYGILKKYLDDLKKIRFKAIIFDESHYLKTSKSQRTKAAKQLAKDIPIRILLTGTPILSRPQEIISQLEIIGRLEEFGGFWTVATKYCGAVRGDFGLEWHRSKNIKEFNDLLRQSCFIRRRKQDVLKELPDKQFSYLSFPITNRPQYDKAAADITLFLADKSVADKEFLSGLIGLDQRERKAAYKAHHQEASYKASQAQTLVRIEALKQLAAWGKLDPVCEWVKDFLDSGQKLILFAHHIEIQDELLKRFPGSAHIQSKDDIQERQRNVNRFQNDDDCKLIVCSLLAAGVGLTLTAASNVAFVELGWTPSVHEQASCRCHRIGQKNSVNVYYFLAENTIDQEINQLLRAKKTIVDESTEGDMGNSDQGILKDLIKLLAR